MAFLLPFVLSWAPFIRALLGVFLPVGFPAQNPLLLER